jgi:hypothetical protein
MGAKRLLMDVPTIGCVTALVPSRRITGERRT